MQKHSSCTGVELDICADRVAPRLVAIGSGGVCRWLIDDEQTPPPRPGRRSGEGNHHSVLKDALAPEEQVATFFPQSP